jgi:flagellin
MLAIKNNLMAQGAARHLGTSYEHLATSVERLSSGLRVNSAKDDAAGLAVRELIRADVAALQQGSRNAQDGVSMLQAAEGALGEVDAILIRMRELAEQAATGTYSNTQKSVIQGEFDELTNEITRISETTDFNDINLLNSGSGSVEITLGKGVTTGKTISVDKNNMSAVGLGLLGKQEVVALDDGNAITLSATGDALFSATADGTGTVAFTYDGTTVSLSVNTAASNDLTFQEVADALTDTSSGFGTNVTVAINTSGYLSITHAEVGTKADITIDATDVNYGDTSGGAVAATDTTITEGDTTTTLDLDTGTDAIGAIDSAIENKDSYRAKLGYWMNRLEYAASVLNVQSENLAAAESRISDVDVASEMSMMTRNQVLAQAGISMLAQANSMPQMALSLLQ